MLIISELTVIPSLEAETEFPLEYMEGSTGKRTVFDGASMSFIFLFLLYERTLPSPKNVYISLNIMYNITCIYKKHFFVK
jgi:hypothetical protein